MTTKPIRTAAAAAVAAAALVLGPVATASAHVSASTSSAVAGSSTIITLSVPHGCEGSATTKVAIQIPEGINAVTPTRNAFYTLAKVPQKLDTPITDGHGNQITERVAQVVYTATTPLPEGQRDTFELSLTLPAADAPRRLSTSRPCRPVRSARSPGSSFRLPGRTRTLWRIPRHR